jgi:hypothetical protein
VGTHDVWRDRNEICSKAAALAVATLLWPPERMAVRLAALAVQALLIAPMAARVLVTRRTRE